MVFKKKNLFIIGLITLCLTCFCVYLFNPPQNILEDRIFHERGYKITNQSQTIFTQFTFDPNWVPKKRGQHNYLHYVFYNNYNTEIIVNDVYNRDDGTVYVYIDCKSKYFKSGGEFVNSIVFHNENNVLSYSWIPFSPLFNDPNSGKVIKINYGSGTGPKSLLMFYLIDKDAKQYLSSPLVIKINNFNLITYTK